MKYIGIGLSCIILAILTATGTLQKAVHFHGIANEFFFFIMALTTGIFCLIAGFTPDKKTN